MTPYRATTNGSAEATYNTKLAKARNIVERTIGVTKSRFRCLLGERQLHYKPEKAVKIVNVCSALHNICIAYGVDFEDEDHVAPNTEDQNYAEEHGGDVIPSTEASDIREQIKQSFL